MDFWWGLAENATDSDEKDRLQNALKGFYYDNFHFARFLVDLLVHATLSRADCMWRAVAAVV